MDQEQPPRQDSPQPVLDENLENRLRELVRDTEAVSASKRESQIRILTTSTNERVSLIRDSISVVMPSLLAAAAIYLFRFNQVKTIALFYTGACLLVTAFVFGFIVRNRLIKYVDDVIHEIESWYVRLTERANDLKSDLTRENFDALEAAKVFELRTPLVRWHIDRGYLLVIYCMLLGITLVVASLLFEIRT